MALFDTFNPLAALMARVNPNAAAGGEPSTPAAQPPAVTPANGSPPSDGGGSIFANIGTRMSQAINGERGIFAGAPDAAADAEIDPLTGVPRGIGRRVNNQSMMRMGLMLMAAGQRQSQDSRARILAAAAGATDTSESLNRFAANRLEMAKLKLVERQQAQEAASLAAMNSMMGVAEPDRAAAIQAGVSPVEGTTADPNAQQPPLAPVPGGGVSPAPGTPEGAPPVLSAATLPTAAPTPPGVGAGWVPTPEDRRIYSMIPSIADKQKFIQNRMTEFADTEIKSKPYMDPSIGIMVDVYKNGRKIGVEKLGDPTETIIPTVDKDSGATIYRKITADGRMTDVEVVRDPVMDAARKKADEARYPTDQGYMTVPDGKGGFKVEVAPGSKAAREIQTEAATEEARRANDVAGADRLTGTIGDMITLVKDAPWYSPVTGIGQLIGKLPIESNAADYAALADTLGGNIAFDRLEQMRTQESPSGGSLGSITEREIEMLRNTMHSISQAQSRPQLLKHLKLLDEQYKNVMAKAAAYPNAEKYGFVNPTAPGDGKPANMPVGTEVDGYIFLGGDPNNEASWKLK